MKRIPVEGEPLLSEIHEVPFAEIIQYVAVAL